jgi:hypothetical protein
MNDMFGAFPKIFALGQPHVEHLFDGPVEITEKIDGSQFAFGYDENCRFRMRSKGQEIIEGAPNKMFQEAHDFALSVAGRVPSNMVLYGEYLQKPKHNILTYGRIPTNHFMIFGAVQAGEFQPHSELCAIAALLDCEAVPLLFQGQRDPITPAELKTLLERESALGNVKIEGIVIKNHSHLLSYKGLYLPITAAKYVSEAFKEVLDKEWKIDQLKDSLRTEARWLKAVAHLREAGKLQVALQDIGPLIAEVRRDIAEEEKEQIKNALWRIFADEIMRNSIRGLKSITKKPLTSSGGCGPEANPSSLQEQDNDLQSS